MQLCVNITVNEWLSSVFIEKANLLVKSKQLCAGFKEPWRKNTYKLYMPANRFAKKDGPYAQKID